MTVLSRDGARERKQFFSSHPHNIFMYNKIDYYFLFAAFLSFLASIALWFLYDHDHGLFVGIWVPSILALWTGTRQALSSLSTKSKSPRK